MQNSILFILYFYQTLKRYTVLLLNCSSVSYNLSCWSRLEREWPGCCQQWFVPYVSLEYITHLYPWEVLLLKIVSGLPRHIFSQKVNSVQTLVAQETHGIVLLIVFVLILIHLFMRKNISFWISLIIVAVGNILTPCYWHHISQILTHLSRYSGHHCTTLCFFNPTNWSV